MFPKKIATLFSQTEGEGEGVKGRLELFENSSVLVWAPVPNADAATTADVAADISFLSNYVTHGGTF